MLSVAAARGSESVWGMVMARKERREKDFILEEGLCDNGMWTPGVARDIMLKKSFAGRLLKKNSAL